MTLKASVIVPTFQDWDGLQLCLDCLAGQTVAPETFEVIVANNNGPAEVPASLRLPANARIVHAPKPGSYAARNVALAEARGEALFFTDSDCQPDRSWIEAGLASLATAGPTGRVAGAIQLFPAGRDWTGPELFDLVHGLRQTDYCDEGWCATANLATSRAAFDLTGRFREDIFSSGDREWGMRAHALGSPIIYCARTAVRHPARASFAELSKKRRRIVGGQHQGRRLGTHRPRSLFYYMRLIRWWEVRRTLNYPGLSDGQRLQILWICLRLGMVSLTEVVRLRYLSGQPSRS